MPPSNTNTEIALIKNDISYMKWDIQDIKKILKEFIDSAPDKFATKEQHEQNSKRIEELESDKKAVLKWIVLAFISSLWVFLWIDKFL